MFTLIKNRRKWYQHLIFLLIALFAVLAVIADDNEQSAADAKIAVAFNSQCDELLIANIAKAKHSIYAAVYTFAKKSIALALIERAKQGVKIHLKIDKLQSEFKYTKILIGMMRKSGITITLINMPKKTCMHDKFAVIDKEIVMTGSFNWTRTASEKNYENIVMISSAKIAEKYIRAWEKIKNGE